ncbi:MAG: SIS domain-containing protein [Methanoregulaceae archaeon]|nr:SIS domain-containing protein [Methanoregulaceae archaeon]
MDEPRRTETDRIMGAYQGYLETVCESVREQEETLDHLYARMKDAGAIHCYGFGRSGSAALSLAIRLRHFCEYLPPVWWVGDQARMPMRAGDLVILFSGSGERPEVLCVAQKAKSVDATVFLVTTRTDSSIGALAQEKIVLPVLDEPFVYGGGDFEVASYLLQEIVVAGIGTRFHIPKKEVDTYHV